MKSRLLGLFIALTLTSIACQAQAPAGSTGQCKDGTYTSATTKSGACGGHKGVQTWYATSGKAAAKPVSTSSPAPTSKSTTAAAPAAVTPAPKSAAGSPAAAAQKTAAAKPAPAAAPNAGDIASAKAKGMVWANLNTKVYHSSNDKEYGTTKNGKFMTETDAKAAGYRLAKN